MAGYQNFILHQKELGVCLINLICFIYGVKILNFHNILSDDVFLFTKTFSHFTSMLIAKQMEKKN